MITSCFPPKYFQDLFVFDKKTHRTKINKNHQDVKIGIHLQFIVIVTHFQSFALQQIFALSSATFPHYFYARLQKLDLNR